MSLAAKFFMDSFGKFFVSRTGDDAVDMQTVLSQSYPVVGKSTISRLSSGWVIIRPNSCLLHSNVAVDGVEKTTVNINEAFARELAQWDGVQPRIFVQFDKTPLSTNQVFLSLDKRFVRICRSGGVTNANWLSEPPKPKNQRT